MPYLTKDFKTEIDTDGEFLKLRHYLSSLDLKNFTGAITYVIYTLTLKWIMRNGKSFWHFACILGAIICAVLEIYRRLIAPYEDAKISNPNNGDIE